jgi:hypothetical protein
MANPLRDDNPEGPQPEQGGGIFGRWKDWLSEPANSSALIGFGAQMLQPRAAGQTFAGSLGQALSTGGEAAANIQKQDLAEREVESKEDLRGAQAEKAQAQQAADAQYWENQQQRLRETETHNTLGEYMAKQTAVNKANAEIEKRNSAKMSTDPSREAPLPMPTLQEHLAERAIARAGAARGPTHGTNGKQIDPRAVDVLRTAPQRMRDFDTEYGDGTAEQFPFVREYLQRQKGLKIAPGQ